MVTFPLLLLLREKGVCSHLLDKNLVRFLEIKMMKVWQSKTRLLGVFNSQASPDPVTRNSSKLPCICSYLFKAPVASVSGKLISALVLCIHQFSGF